MSETPSEPQADLLGRLVRELERRSRTEPGPGRQAFDRELVELVELVASALERPPNLTPVTITPRRIAVALGLALHSAPHFVATLPIPARDGTVDPGEPARRSAVLAPVVTDEHYERVLGLVQWEVDELREEIDRRAGKVLKQLRTVNWLWSFFSMPTDGAAQTLGRILYPGTEDRRLEVVRRGGHLYLVLDLDDDAPLPSMFLPWLAPDPNSGPGSLQSRTVDRGLRSRLARGVGADDEEVGELLEEIVTLLPRRGLGHFLRLDQWRSYGYAVITDLGTPYTAAAWLTRPLPPDGADWRAWLRVGPNGALGVRGTPEKVFDALALPRATAMTRQLYAALLAGLDRDRRADGPMVRPEDLDLYDVPRHMRAVLSPLLGWAGKSSTHKWIAKELERPVEEVTVVLEQVREAWTTHAHVSWYGPPGTKTPSIQTLILEHVITLHHSMRQAMRAEPDRRGEHVDVMLLFAAHYLREARLERLWVKSLSDCADGEERIPLPEDVVGSWFWRMWRRLLDEIESDGGGVTGEERDQDDPDE
ncbi:MAG: hypothetical protein ABMA64_26710 [Myxococcota bacterium]